MVRRSAHNTPDDELRTPDRLRMPADSFLFERVVPGLLILAAVLMIGVLILVVAALAGVI